VRGPAVSSQSVGGQGMMQEDSHGLAQLLEWHRHSVMMAAKLLMATDGCSQGPS
jgi:hypothetical protein